MNRQRSDVIVIGGGLAGLAAAATTVAGGAATLVLEAHQPGGRARTATREGFRYNFGPHALYTGGPGMEALATLGIHPAGSPPPLERYRLLMDGRQHMMPVGVRSLVRTSALGLRSKAQLARLLSRLPLLDASALAGMSTAEWLENLDLRPDALAVMQALIRLTTYVADFERFGADAAAGQLQLSTKGVLYLHGGWQSLVDALAGRANIQRGRVTGVEPAGADVEVHVDTGDGESARLHAAAVVVAAGTPRAAASVLGETVRSNWGDLGPKVEGACLDLATVRVPHPGWVLSADTPIYGTTQGPPARLAPDGQAVVSLIRYGARNAKDDRADLHTFLGQLGIQDADVVFDRFLARMTVAGIMPLASSGGLGGRPAADASGLPSVYLAGDWVGTDGLLADAALASGHRAGKLALQALCRVDRSGLQQAWR